MSSEFLQLSIPIIIYMCLVKVNYYGKKRSLSISILSIDFPMYEKEFNHIYDDHCFIPYILMTTSMELQIDFLLNSLSDHKSFYK